jgi:TIR domain
MTQIPADRLQKSFGLRVFLSYARRDEVHGAVLFDVLRQTLEAEGWIKLWFDEHLTPAAKWDEEIKQKLLESDIIILLLSKNFINSNYCMSTELPLALRMYQEGKTIIPILIEAIDLDAPALLDIKAIQHLPRKKPIKEWVTESRAIENVLYHVRRIVIKAYAEKSGNDLSPGLSMRFMKRLYAVQVKSRSRAIILTIVGTLLGVLLGRLVPLINPGEQLTTFLSCVLSICIMIVPLHAAEKSYPYLRRGYRSGDFQWNGLFGFLENLVIVVGVLLLSAISGVLYGSLLATVLFVAIWSFNLKLIVGLAGWMIIGAFVGMFFGYVAYHGSQDEKYIPGDSDDKWTLEPVDAELDPTFVR